MSWIVFYTYICNLFRNVPETYRFCLLNCILGLNLHAMFRNVQVYERYLVISQNAHVSTRNIPCMFPPMITKLFRRVPNPGSMRRATARFVKGAIATNFTSPVVKTGNIVIGNKVYKRRQCQNITFSLTVFNIGNWKCCCITKYKIINQSTRVSLKLTFRFL